MGDANVSLNDVNNNQISNENQEEMKVDADEPVIVPVMPTMPTMPTENEMEEAKPNADDIQNELNAIDEQNKKLEEVDPIETEQKVETKLADADANGTTDQLQQQDNIDGDDDDDDDIDT